VAAAAIPRVSPLRPDAIIEPARAPAGLPPIAPPNPIPTYAERADLADLPPGDEPALPDEARASAAGVADAATQPTTAGAGAVLHVRFRGRESTPLLEALKAFRDLIRQRPGETPVLVHLDVAGGDALPMVLRPVAYDADLVAEVCRRLGDGIVELSLA